PHFRPHRHLMSAGRYRFEMRVRFTIWDQITGAAGVPSEA
ncbi:IS6 family transposase, partial [Streptomyces violascens]